ncbi:MAG TPA: hypothetical protein VEL07_16595 [Planctomycetota bacterium]|nr:hypothetical protein [Planctomycetota bacterium]
MSLTDKQAAAKLLHDLLTGPGNPAQLGLAEMAEKLGVRMTEQRGVRIKAALEKVATPFVERLKKIMPKEGEAAAGDAE